MCSLNLMPGRYRETTSFRQSKIASKPNRFMTHQEVTSDCPRICEIIMKTAAVKADLFRWACERHAANDFPEKEQVRDKALELTELYGLKGFKCSDKWLAQFLKEHGFSDNLRKNHGGPVFSDYRDWIDLMRPTIVKYRHRDLFHVDELTMYSDIPPSKIPPDRYESSMINGSPLNRITILMGCNSTGTNKLPLLISGPYPSKITVKEHVYCHTDDSYIGEDLFKTWLEKLNDRMVCCNRKILLFLQRTRAESLKDFAPSNLRLVYLPENFPPLLRPLRRDVFHYVKIIFRRRYAEHLKRYNSEWGLRDILSSVIEAWEKIPQELIVFSFQRTQFRTDDCFLRIDCDCWDNRQETISFRRFVTFDDDLSDERISQDKEDDSYDGYIRKDNSNEVIEIDENTLESVSVDLGRINNAKLGNLSDESKRVYPSILRKRKGHTDRQSDDTMVMTRGRVQTDKHRIVRESRLKKNPIEYSGKRGKSQKRNYVRAEFSAKRRVDNNLHLPKEILRKAFLSMQPVVRLLKLTRGTMSEKRPSLKYRVDSENNCEESPQAIVHTICVSSRETSSKTERSTKFKDMNEQRDHELLECVSRETDAAPRLNESHEGKNEIDGNTVANILGKFNQPSTLTNNSSGVPAEIGQRDSKEVNESRNRKASSPDVSKLDAQHQDPSQNSSREINLSNENNSCSIDCEASQFYHKKRRKSDSDTDSECNSNHDKPKAKELKLDQNWTKQFENTFVFGTSNVNSLDRQEENILNSNS